MLAAIGLIAGCVRSDTTECGAALCREGTVCAPVTEPDELLCVTAEQVAVCKDQEPGRTCTYALGPGFCIDGVCLPSVCGDGRIAPDETCDDDNLASGDGCSSDCRSDETCGNQIIDPVTAGMPNERCDDGNAVGHDGCHDCQLETPSWSVIPTASGPQERHDHALAYDAAREQIVMFGGAPVVGPLDDTWRWDGIGWRELKSNAGPARRRGHAMAYDALRQRTILFGGQYGLDFADTWEFDGVRWNLLPATGSPGARADHAMAYDARRGTIVMFGGKRTNNIGDTGPLGDTWELADEWQPRILAPAPPARSGHGLAYDPARGVTVLVGGMPITRSTWELDGTSWREIVAPLGTRMPEGDVALAWDPTSRRVLAFGGTPGTSNATWTWDGQSWTELAPAQRPIARVRPALATYAASSRVILFGGCVTPPSCASSTRDDTWAWNGTTWTEITPVPVQPPTARGRASATHDSRRDRVVLFGGTTATSPTNETYEHDGAHWYRFAPAIAPDARDSPIITFDAIRGETILFSGGFAADTWRWRDGTWTDVTPVGLSPAPRVGHGMAFDLRRARIVLFGGASATHLDDTWEWDGATWSKITPTGAHPSARREFAIAYDPVRERTILFGGQSPATTTAFGDTWSWDGVAWTDVTPIGALSPPARSGARLAWDGARGRLVLFGGLVGGTAAINDVHAWDGVAWTPVSATDPPSSRGEHAMATAPGGAGVVIFGGREVVAFDDLVHLAWNSAGDYETCVTNVDSDRDGLAGCADPDCWSTCSPLCPPGTSCTPTYPRCGDQMCDPVETCGMCNDCTCASVCGDFTCDPNETCLGDC